MFKTEEEIRQIQEEIAAGTYVTPHKIDVTVARITPVINGDDENDKMSPIES